MSKTLYIGLDIDATVIEHCYPLMNGEDLGAVPWLLKIQEDFPVAFLLNTMRSGGPLMDAARWLTERGVQITGAGTHPTQKEWTDSPKCHCHVYIDDRAVGVPLRPDMSIDWAVFGPMVYERVQLWHNYYEENGASATGPVTKSE